MKNLNSFPVHFCSRRRTLQDVLMLWYDLCSATDILIIVILTISSSHWVFSEHIVVLWWNIVQLNRAQSSIQKFVRTVITLRKYIHNYISTYLLYWHCFLHRKYLPSKDVTIEQINVQSYVACVVWNIIQWSMLEIFLYKTLYTWRHLTIQDISFVSHK